MDIKIRKRMMSIREIQIENMQQTSEYLRLRREGMRRIHQTCPEGDLGLGACCKSASLGVESRFWTLSEPQRGLLRLSGGGFPSF